MADDDDPFAVEGDGERKPRQRTSPRDDGQPGVAEEKPVRVVTPGEQPELSDITEEPPVEPDGWSDESPASSNAVTAVGLGLRARALHKVRTLNTAAG